jgi:hypothetical protein
LAGGTKPQLKAVNSAGVELLFQAGFNFVRKFPARGSKKGRNGISIPIINFNPHNKKTGIPSNGAIASARAERAVGNPKKSSAPRTHDQI